jgi:hypothetical protein
MVADLATMMALQEWVPGAISDRPDKPCRRLARDLRLIVHGDTYSFFGAVSP